MSPLPAPTVMDLLFNFNDFYGYSLRFVPYLYNSTHHQKSGKCENSAKNWPDYVKIAPQNSTDYVKSAN